MVEQSEIPEDVMHAAKAIAQEWSYIDLEQYEGDFVSDLADDFARAILAERERCAKVASNFIDNVEIEVEGRSRFSIYDLNREAKKSVRYVKDQITGEFYDNWISK